MKKKIIILGPIADVGGREVEVSIIAKALVHKYDVNILSTSYITKNSFALKNIDNVKWNSLQKIFYSKNIVIRFLSILSRKLNKGNSESCKYVSNSISKQFFNIDNEYVKILKQELLDAEMVILCTQLTTKFLPEIIDFCNSNNIKCLLRTTGTIRMVDKNSFDMLKKVDLFIHHSENNAKNLNDQIDLPYKIIDQCTLSEQALSKLPIINKKPFRFGFFGRLSKEKGIMPLADFFINTDYEFIIAGDGPQKEELINKIKENPKIHYLGLVQSNLIADFFKKIDILIISSHEESGPLVGVEAMAAAKIIISTNVGAMKSRLNDTLNNFWFDIEKIETLNDLIIKIEDLDDLNLNRISENVRYSYIENLSVNNIEKKYQNLVNSFLDA